MGVKEWSVDWERMPTAEVYRKDSQGFGFKLFITGKNC